ncbi:conserved Plasmodium protein, unknown function [Plasmodium relictum]|uniref:Poly(A) RNA polymerase mitochondrial-like central palm domain-containing protein n=1 Tax=Plasmodium relictum TaxID=85471 RepID=A0A1J1HCL8_PLARL|nr:conserved Plasmodium protein, unknown function [Plasmodium relictum]CRH02696.1 conserved Plasmodium protein, unknown function [Plasmodium relictum]
MTKRNKIVEILEKKKGNKEIKKIAGIQRNLYNSFSEHLFYNNEEHINEKRSNSLFNRKKKKTKKKTKKDTYSKEKKDIYLKEKRDIYSKEKKDIIMSNLLNSKSKHEYNKIQNNSYKKVKRLNDNGIFKHYSKKKKGFNSFSDFRYERSRWMGEEDKNVLSTYIEELRKLYLYKNSNYDSVINEIKKDTYFCSISEKMNDSNTYDEKNIVNTIKSQFISNSLIKVFNNIGREIVYLIHLMKPTSIEILIRKQILKRIKQFLKKVFPTFYMIVFGSCNTDLDIYNSDIDICIYNECKSNKNNIHVLYNKMSKDKLFTNTDIKKILHARVPIVKCYFREVQLSIDISFNQISALTSTIKTQNYIKNNSLIKYLIMFLKIFLSQNDLNDASKGGISSFNVLLMLTKFLNENEFVFYKKNSFLYIGEVVLKFISHFSLFKDKSNMVLFLNNSKEYDFSKLNFFNKKNFSFFNSNLYLNELFDDIFCTLDIINPLEDEKLTKLTFDKIFKIRICFKDALFSLSDFVLRYIKKYGKDYYLKYDNIFKNYFESIYFLNYLGDIDINENLKKYYEFFQCNIQNFDKLIENKDNYNNTEFSHKEKKTNSSFLICSNNNNNNSNNICNINCESVFNSHISLNENNIDYKNKDDKVKYKSENPHNSINTLISFFLKIFKENNVKDYSLEKNEINDQYESNENRKITKNDFINVTKHKNNKEYKINQNDIYTDEKMINKHKVKIDKKYTEYDLVNLYNSDIKKKINSTLKPDIENLNSTNICRGKVDKSANDSENISNKKNYPNISLSSKNISKRFRIIGEFRKDIDSYDPEKLESIINNIYKLFDNDNENEYVFSICKNFRALKYILKVNKLIYDRFNYYSLFKDIYKDEEKIHINDNKLIEKLKKEMLINLLNMKKYDTDDLIHLEINNDVFIGGHTKNATKTHIDLDINI